LDYDSSLLINPGNVSKNYVDGKRQRYTNPFRFYLTVSIIFFLLVGLYSTKEKYNSLVKKGKTNNVDLIKRENSQPKGVLIDKKIDSIKKELDSKMKGSFIPVSEKTRNKIFIQS